MTHEQLRRLIAAPELVVINLVDAAMIALDLALLAEHPLLVSDDAAIEDPPVRRRARALREHALRLRRALDAYQRAVDRALHPQRPPDDLPF
jgi:hypothetical protein